MASVRRLIALALLPLALLGGRAQAGPAAPAGQLLVPADVPTLPLSEIKPGMEGYGLTVFQGTKPDRFHIVVLGVLHNFLPRQDILLIKSDDPRVVYSGVVHGMSGSPIYIDGKLVGALAYAWSFSKDAIAGVTPIQNMKAELDRPLRGPGSTLMASAGEIDLARFHSDPFAPSVRTAPLSMRRGHDAIAPSLLDLLPLPRRPLLDGASEPRLLQAAVPLTVAGMSPGSLASLADALEPYGVDVMAGGSGGSGPIDPAAPASFGFGDSLALQLARGDVSMAAVGTVTWVNGPHVLAFGHPMFGAGELYVPIATANVVTVLPSVESSVKMAEPVREIGTLTQDRQACIVGDTSRQSTLVPVDVTVTGVGPAPRVFHTEVARHKFLTPVLAEQMVAAAVSSAASDVAAATLTVDGTLYLHGYAPLELVDDIYSQDGVSAVALAQVRAIRYLAPLLFNPFAPVELERVEVKVGVTYKPLVASLTSAFVSDATLPPGGRVTVYATLEPYGQSPEVTAIPIDIPASLAGQNVKITIEDGSTAHPDVAPPQNLDELVGTLRKSYPANSMVVTLQSADEGVTMAGEVVPDLPPSVVDSLRPAGASQRGDPFHTSFRVVVPTARVVQGHQELSLHVREAR